LFYNYFKHFKEVEMNKKGFTLTELLIVVAIIGVLAAIAIPAYVGQTKRAARTEAYTNLQSLRLLEEQYYAENGCYYRTGATPVCTDATRTGIAEIQQNASANPFLPGFKPGDEASLSFTYSITTTSVASAFTATATGKSGTRVDGDSFWIKQDNTKNF
jgi:prepilin-type N-terminal cleavage/methylation domain-containing protein